MIRGHTCILVPDDLKVGRDLVDDIGQVFEAGSIGTTQSPETVNNNGNTRGLSLGRLPVHLLFFS